MYSSGILRNTSSSPCPNAPQNKARPARTARREKPHTMGSMTPPPPPLFPAPQAFLDNDTSKMPADTLLPATTSTGRSAQAIGFLQEAIMTVFQHRSGTLDIPLRGLGRLRKIQCRTAIPHFREPQSGAANFKRHYACGVSSPPLLRLRLRFRLRRRPGPGCRDYPRHDLLRGGTPHSQPRRHLLQVPDRHSSHRRVHGSDHVPAASVSATARPTASPAAAMTGKSGGVIFRACTYGFRQGQFRNLPLDKLLDTVEFTLLLLVHERNGPPVALARAVRPMRWI